MDDQEKKNATFALHKYFIWANRMRTHFDELLQQRRKKESAGENVDLLKRYRNGVFHFQPEYFDARFMDLITKGQDVVVWVRSLNEAVGGFFLRWLDDRRLPSADTKVTT